MVLTFRTIAGIFAATATLLFRYGHNHLGILSVLFTIFSLIIALFLNTHKSKARNYKEEQSSLFKAALKTIDSRSRITLALINDFKTVFDENRFFINRNQKKVLSGLLYDLQDLRIIQEERKGNVSESERKSLVANERTLLNCIESMKTTIENYSKKLT